MRLLLRPLALLLALAPAAAAGRPASEPPAEAVLAELLFQPSEESNRVVVDLAPDGAPPFRLLLDTGAVTSLITPRMARELNVAVRRSKSTPYRRGTRLGKDVQFWVDTRRSDTSSRAGVEVGLLGADFYDDWVVEIDFAARRVRFLDPKQYEVPKQVDVPLEHVLPLRVVAGRIAVPIELEGSELWAVVDTGDPSSASIDGKVARKLGLDVGGLPDFATAAFLVGTTEAKLWEAGSFRIAGVSFDLLPVTVLPHGAFNLGFADDVVIGYDVLRHFRVRIDYPRRRLWLEQVPGQRVTLLGADYRVAREIGAFLVPSGSEYDLGRVLPDGAAAHFGLREDDRIAAPEGGALPDPVAVAARIRARQPVAIRRREGGAWKVLELPEAAPAR
jgi:predicted aspartyl protease